MIKNIIQTIVLSPVIIVLAIILAAGLAICLLGVTFKHGAGETAEVLTVFKDALETSAEEIQERE